jgi:hypothetical protein
VRSYDGAGQGFEVRSGTRHSRCDTVPFFLTSVCHRCPRRDGFVQAEGATIPHSMDVVIRGIA